MTDDVQNEKTETQEAVDTGAKAETNESQAAEAEGGAQAASEQSLDDLLKEFEKPEGQTEQHQESRQQTRSSEQQQDGQHQQSAVDPEKLSEIEAELAEIRRERAANAVKSVVAAIKGDSDVKDRVAQAWLDAAAAEDPRISMAFHSRHENPRAWAKVQASLAKEFRKEFGVKVDQQATESRDAVSAAVRGSSTAAQRDSDFPSDKEVMTLPQDEFNELQRKLGVSPL